MTDRREPVPHTCPHIDGVIETLKQCVKDLEYVSRIEDIDEIKSYTSSIAWDLSSLYDGRKSPVETIRTANDKLRTWGNDLVEDIKELEDELNKVEHELIHPPNYE